jgi:hypothetical protein
MDSQEADRKLSLLPGRPPGLLLSSSQKSLEYIAIIAYRCARTQARICLALVRHSPVNLFRHVRLQQRITKLAMEWCLTPDTFRAIV